MVEIAEPEHDPTRFDGFFPMLAASMPPAAGLPGCTAGFSVLAKVT